MIHIRTITYNLPNQLRPEIFETIERAHSFWQNVKYPVHTHRLNLPPQAGSITIEKLDRVAQFAQETGIRWFNVPFDPWTDDGFDGTVVEKILKRFDNAFCNIICAKDGKIREDIFSEVIAAIRGAADVDTSGSGNFRFGAAMNVASNGPFFPFTYSGGGSMCFSIGLELAREINQIVGEGYVNLTQLRRKIIDHLEPQIHEIETLAETCTQKCGLIFAGIDFSLAPLPEEGSSVITILNSLGIMDINCVGTMFGTGYLTDILKHFAANHKSVGFAGVMYSLLEDREYAAINDQNGFSLDRMIALSTMCGCGVDMVPIDYNTDDATLRTVLMEIACVSSRLKKPLGVRILPLHPDPDSKTQIDENEDFIVNTKLVDAKTNTLPDCGQTYLFGSII